LLTAAEVLLRPFAIDGLDTSCSAAVPALQKTYLPGR
jgi:hypothetical protein